MHADTRSEVMSSCPGDKPEQFRALLQEGSNVLLPVRENGCLQVPHEVDTSCATVGKERGGSRRGRGPLDTVLSEL